MTGRATLDMWVADPPDEEVRAALERLRNLPGVRHIAAMPDVHFAEGVCIGVVAATDDMLIPQAVGGDIGCGMTALALDAGADFLATETRAREILDGLRSRVPTNRHPRATMPEGLPDELEERPLSAARLEAMKSRDARVQLGTLGRGNHFLEFQADEEDRLWLMIHSGSRAFGQAATAVARERCTRRRSGVDLMPTGSRAAEAYLADLAWALDYAAANRAYMAAVVTGWLDEAYGVGADPGSRIDCHHNFVRRETHFGRALWVHRKGAVSASRGEPGIIPGSMGAPSYHVEGRGLAAALASSSHGAGRSRPRGAAMREISLKRLESEMRGVWFDRGLAPRLRDEAPGAYKDIGAVMRAQRKLTRIVRRLRPLLAYKGA